MYNQETDTDDRFIDVTFHTLDDGSKVISVIDRLDDWRRPFKDCEILDVYDQPAEAESETADYQDALDDFIGAGGWERFDLDYHKVRDRYRKSDGVKIGERYIVNLG